MAGGVPDISINDCARMLTSLSGSGVYEQSRQVGISEAIGSFVKEMRPFPSMNGDAGQFYQKTNDIGDVDKKGLDATLTITSNNSKRNTWIGFKVDGAMYLRGNGWDDMDIREVSLVLVLFVVSSCSFLIKPRQRGPFMFCCDYENVMLKLDWIPNCNCK